CGLAASVPRTVTRPPALSGPDSKRFAALTSAYYHRPSSVRITTNGSAVSLAGHSRTPWMRRGSPGAACAADATRTATLRATIPRLMGHLRAGSHRKQNATCVVGDEWPWSVAREGKRVTTLGVIFPEARAPFPLWYFA